jgi:hypothetical protein
MEGSVTVVDQDASWWDEAACLKEDTSLFFPHVHENDGLDEDGTPLECIHEPDYPSAEVRAICGLCPVRAECLDYALKIQVQAPGKQKADWVHGSWAATTYYTRGLMRRRQVRVSCPSCHSRDVIDERHDQVCLSCGASWPR